MKHVRAPIALVLALMFAGLTALTGGVIATVLYTTAHRNTIGLMAEVGRTELDSLRQSLQVELAPAKAQSDFLSEYIERGSVSLNDNKRIADLLLGSLASSRQLFGVALIRADLSTVAAARSLNGKPYVTDQGSALKNPLLLDAYRKGSAMPAADWGGPVFSNELKINGLTRLTPLRKNGQLVGVIATLISVPEINRQIVARIGMNRGEAFVLLDDGSVLVHPAIYDGRYVGSTTRPLPLPPDLADPVLSSFDPRKKSELPRYLTDLDFSLQRAMVDGVDRVYLFQPVLLSGSQPWTMVLTMRADELGEQLTSLTIAAWSSFGVAVFAVLAAILVGRKVSRPIQAFAIAARHLNALDFEHAPPIERSRLREFDMAAEAYNGMRAGLSWFATYVPRSLVPVLMRPDSAESFTSKEREVTVLFTDIVGFTAISQRLRAPALARFLNRHFGMLGAAIDAEGGTIDKYIGDSVMAFWGAPSAQADHAERAVRAALAIGERLKADNARRRRKGLNPVRVRIGIHSGLALAGNIGAPGRINYTLVGDTVNVAQRLEQYGKQIDDGGTDVIIVISQAVADRLPVEIPRQPLGMHAVMHRGEPVMLYRLDRLTPVPAEHPLKLLQGS